MGRRHFKPEQIIHILRETEIKLAGGKTTGEVCRELASEYGCYGYRRITALLRHQGWHVNHKCVERIWRREGLVMRSRFLQLG